MLPDGSDQSVSPYEKNKNCAPLFIISECNKTRRMKEEVERQHQDRPAVWQVSEGSGEQGNVEKTGCKVICGAETTLVVKGLMMTSSRQT